MTQPGIHRGMPLPLGAFRVDGGTNFAVFSRNATAMELLLYDRADDATPAEIVPLDPLRHRTGDVWHVWLDRTLSRHWYALRTEPGGPALLDPGAVALAGVGEWDLRAPGIAKALAGMPAFDWGDERRPARPWRDMVIYETHVRGLTIHPSSGVAHPGQYLGVAEKVPYLRELGITAIELMPVQEFSAWDADRRDPLSGRRLPNYWGYNPVGLFAPKESYAGPGLPGRQLDAFRTMVRALHAAGIEVLLDVVLTHTAEGGAGGPVFAFRGLDDDIYYIHAASGGYADYSGCGNSLNCNHPVVRGILVDCLRHWVMHMRIDGFRFDLASILGRDEQGALVANPPVLEQIAEDPVLRGTKLIAEAWDAGGAFQVGSFPGPRWAEWNSFFRDDVRRFWRGDAGFTGQFATRLCGSADLYQRPQESPVNSINYVTCHDGFTLNDLVSFAEKHNQANGEGDRDGMVENWSENNGIEGPTDDAAIEAVRQRQVRNMLATLLLSRGVPMLQGGDEFRRTQRGNNNPYCQDNEISWYDWRLAEHNAGLVRFVQRLTAFRRAHPVLSAESFYTADEIAWFGADGAPPDWNGPRNLLGYRVDAAVPLCLLFNATRAPCRFLLPAGSWRVVFDTARDPPDDAPEADRAPELAGAAELAWRSALALVFSETPRPALV